MNKKFWLDLAELVDSFRVFPRLFLVATFAWTAHTSYWLLSWYMALPAGDRGIEASGFASVAMIGILGFLKLVYDTYSKAGRSWGPPEEPQ